MQDSREPQLGRTDELGVLGQLDQARRSGVEQGSITFARMRADEATKFFRHRERDQEVGTRQQLIELRLQPLFGFLSLTHGTMTVPAGTRCKMPPATIATAVEHASQFTRPATLQHGHRLELVLTHAMCVLLQVGRSVLTKDATDGGAASNVAGGSVEAENSATSAGGCCQVASHMITALTIGHQGVDLGHGDFFADGGQVQIDRGGVDGLVGRGRLFMVASFARENPERVAMGGPVNAHHAERLCGQRHEPVLVSLAAPDVNQHPRSIDVRDLQVECFLQTEPQRIDGPEEALHDRLADRRDELIDFGDGQDGGKFGLFGDSQLAERRPLSRTRMGVEELEPRVRDLQRIGFPLLIVLDEQQIASQIAFGGGTGRLLEPLSEFADSAEVGFVRPLTQPGQLHVVQHLLGQR